MAEWRTKELLIAMFAGAVLVVLLFHLAFDVPGRNVGGMVSGALWIAFILSGTVGLGRSFILGRHRGTVDGLLLSPVDHSAIYLARWLSNWFFISLVEVVTLPLASALFDVDLIRPDLLLVTILGTGGFVGMGTLLSAMATNTRTQEILLPLLLIPVCMPLFLAAVKATTGLLDGNTLTEVIHWLQVVVGLDIIFIILPLVLFDYVVEE